MKRKTFVMISFGEEERNKKGTILRNQHKNIERMISDST